MHSRARGEIIRTYESLVEQPQVIDDILSKPVFQQLSGEVSATQGQKFLRELNTEYDRLVDKRSPEAVAYRAIRDELASQLDDIVKLTSGKNIQPYRDFGNIREFRSGVENRLEAARQSAGRQAVPTSPRAELGVSTTLGGQVGTAVARRAARLARPLIKQGIEFVDEAVEAVFKGAPKKLKREDLPEETIADLRRNYLRRPPTPEVVPPPLPAQVPTLEQKIQQTIQSLPREMRGRNERAIAEAILRAQ